jgi:hypothetical protein
MSVGALTNLACSAFNACNASFFFLASATALNLGTTAAAAGAGAYMFAAGGVREWGSAGVEVDDALTPAGAV